MASAPRLPTLSAVTDKNPSDPGRHATRGCDVTFHALLCRRLTWRRIRAPIRKGEERVDEKLQPSPITRFAIRGLHGYKDVEIDFAGKATIIVAENGTGKTTVLNALYAFVSGNFHRLNAVNFTEVECHFQNALFPLVLSKAQLASRNEAADVQIRDLAMAGSASEADVLDFVQTTFSPGDFTRYRGHPLVRQIYLNSHYDYEALEQAFNELYATLDSALPDTARAMALEVRRLMDGVEIVYLPTYRRIERPLRVAKTRNPVGMRKSPKWPGVDQHDMAFGLSDVQERLMQLSEDIERRSNLEYRALTARMLNDMSMGAGAWEHVGITGLPDVDSLSRFLSRVGQAGKSTSTTSLLDRIQDLYRTGGIADNVNGFLRYFLSRLAEVIEETRETELVIERFVEVCNGYLTLSSDEKRLSLDPYTLRVIVNNVWANCQIPMDELSSGEKQIVSLMARLYLSTKPKLILIDEPELSLSLDWQRKVVPDIVNSPTVLQTLAITHSPFIFENELDACARPLRITRSEVVHDQSA